MSITALQGYDGRAFESAALNTGGTILTLTRGDGTTQDVILPAGGSSGGGGSSAPQVGGGNHFLNIDGGGLYLNYAGIKSVSFWMRPNAAIASTCFMADGRTNGGPGYWYEAGCGAGMSALINGTAVNTSNTSGSYGPIMGGQWNLIYIENACAADGLKLFSNGSNTQTFSNVDIADLRSYSRVWTAGEKANITAANVPTDALLGRYDFTVTTTTQVIDQSGNTTSRNATFNGTPGTPI